MLTLLVLAAGWGQRYGGMKQLARVGPCGEFLLDYSMVDAVRAGFGRIVFVLRRDMAQEFDAQFMQPLRAHVQVGAVMQDITDLPVGVHVASLRTKPWGTLHAVWSARHAIDGGFAVINADDFYGAESFEAVARYLREPPESQGTLIQGCMAGYAMANTLSEHGGVNRGVCEVQDGYLQRVHEYTQIERDPAGQLSGLNPAGQRVPLDPQGYSSMNFWGWSGPVFQSIEEHLCRFFQANAQHPKAEAYMAQWWDHLLHNRQGRCRVLPTGAQWTGITYAQDVPRVQARIAQAVQQGRYTAPLWS